MAADQMIRNLSMNIGDVGLGSIELCVIAAEGGCTHKHRVGSPAVPFAREFATTPVNRQSHATQGAPKIRVVARQAITHNSMEPKPTSPIFMLKFLIIWSLLKG